MPVQAVWHGTERDRKRLFGIVENYCECQTLQACCAMHLMLLEQKTLDHFAFVASRRWRYLQDELELCPPG